MTTQFRIPRQRKSQELKRHSKNESDSTLIHHRIWWREMVFPNLARMKGRMKRNLNFTAQNGWVCKCNSAASDGR